jgi:hypothetical protein
MGGPPHEREAGTVRVRVEAPWRASYPDPLLVRSGDVLTTGERSDRWPLFLWCTASDGRAGWVPESVLSIETDGAATAHRDYDTAELTVSPGASVTVLERLAGWSWCRDEAGRCGWVPDEVL